MLSSRSLSLCLFAFGSLVLAPMVQAETPPVLAAAADKWDAAGQDLAFTQRMTTFGKGKEVKETRVARYDPSLSDRERWRLLEINGKPATEKEREDWETGKNRRPRNKGGLSPSSYLDLANARLVEENKEFARFEVGVLKDKARFVATEQLAVVLQVDKKSGTITHVSALLREPMKIALGLAKVTDLDLDLPLEAGQTGDAGGAVKPDATAKLTLTKLGEPVEFAWSDFARVEAHPDAVAAAKK